MTGGQAGQNQGGFQGNTGYVFSQDSNQGNLVNNQVGGYSSTTTTTTSYNSSGSGSPCLNFDNQGRCIACGQGFILSNNACFQSS